VFAPGDPEAIETKEARASEAEFWRRNRLSRLYPSDGQTPDQATLAQKTPCHKEKLLKILFEPFLDNQPVRRIAGKTRALQHGLERVKHEGKSPQICCQVAQDVMPKQVKATIEARGLQIAIHTTARQPDYISITDIAKYKSDAPDDVIKNWMRNRETIEFLGLWEQFNNPDFKPVEFDGFRKSAGRLDTRHVRRTIKSLNDFYSLRLLMLQSRAEALRQPHGLDN
jgi:hypothetical protein